MKSQNTLAKRTTTVVQRSIYDSESLPVLADPFMFFATCFVRHNKTVCDAMLLHARETKTSLFATSSQPARGIHEGLVRRNNNTACDAMALGARETKTSRFDDIVTAGHGSSHLAKHFPINRSSSATCFRISILTRTPLNSTKTSIVKTSIV